MDKQKKLLMRFPRVIMQRIKKCLDEVSVGTGGVSASLTTFTGIFKSFEWTRAGIDPFDKSPFYESDPKKIFQFYPSYASEKNALNNLLYADVVTFKVTGFNEIEKNYIHRENVRVVISTTSYCLPEKLHLHKEAAVDLFKRMGKLRRIGEGNQEWENNTSLRVESMNFCVDSMEVKSCQIFCQKARYFDQVATNLTLDWMSEKLPDNWTTLRSGGELSRNGSLLPFEKSNLANTLGVAVMLYDQTLEPIFRVRSELLASISKRAIHCTASGVHEVDPVQQSGTFDFKILERGMIKEIKDEIGLDEHEYQLFPVAFGRELPRGGKPQLFFVAIAKVDNQRISDAMKSADEAYEYVFGDSHEVNSMLEPLPDISSLFTYEGWACLKFAAMFLEANNDELRRLFGKEI